MNPSVPQTMSPVIVTIAYATSQACKSIPFLSTTSKFLVGQNNSIIFWATMINWIDMSLVYALVSYFFLYFILFYFHVKFQYSQDSEPIWRATKWICQPHILARNVRNISLHEKILGTCIWTLLKFLPKNCIYYLISQKNWVWYKLVTANSIKPITW